jgi:hypothetical protein
VIPLHLTAESCSLSIVDLPNVAAEPAAGLSQPALVHGVLSHHASSDSSFRCLFTGAGICKLRRLSHNCAT